MNPRFFGLPLMGLFIFCSCTTLRGTGDLGLIIERADGRVAILETSRPQLLGSIPGLGDLSHASAVYSRDGRFAFIFGRDGGLTKVDLLTRKIVKRVLQAGNSIGGAISRDGSMVAVSNYEPGGIKVFASDDLTQIADIATRMPRRPPALSTTSGISSPWRLSAGTRPWRSRRPC